MEDKIEVGEYVKLDNGNIGQVIAVEKGSIMLDIKSNRWVGICCIKKHSKNIIDLIEAGDYVNGRYVLKKAEKNKKRKQIIIDRTAYEYGEEELKNEDIETIVTKEQYKQIEYIVEE